jgi:hypothetical protein
VKARPLGLVFVLALAVRVGMVFYQDWPLLYPHQYNYFTGGLRIAQHPAPWRYLLTSDEWRVWSGGGTIAPLYFAFVGAVFRAFGPHLLPLRLIQCVVDALVAVAVASLGRRLAGPLGVLAGVAYALYWSAFEMPNWTMTENLHSILLVGGIALLAAEPERPGIFRAALAGLLLGLSGLARSVSSLFVGIAAFWRLTIGRLERSALLRNLAAAAAVLLAGASVTLAWTARNTLVISDPVFIETVGFFNLWDDNAASLVTRDKYDQQLKIINQQATPSAGGRLALLFTWRNVTRNPGAFFRKIERNFWHFLRPEVANNLLVYQYPDSPTNHALALVLDDGLLLAALPLFLAFLLGGGPSPARNLVLAWTVYYLLMVMVVFHTESRYRSPIVPFVLAGAAGGVAALRGADGVRRRLAGIGLAAGLALSLWVSWPCLVAGARALSAHRALAPVAAALDRGDLAEADRLVAAAAAKDPASARPWFEYGHALALRGRAAEAAAAYQRGQSLPALDWVPQVVLPRLLLESGQTEEAAKALRVANKLSWEQDPWILLEIGWRELPPPRTDELVLAQGDYGAVRNFFYPHGAGVAVDRYKSAAPHRWTRHRAWIRVLPTVAAPRFKVTIEMGSPSPSPVANPEVEVRVNEGPPTRLVLSSEVRPYTLEAATTPGAPVVVRIDAPTWSKIGQPAEQGVRVDRVRVEPAT